MSFRLSDWPRKPAKRRSPADRAARLARDDAAQAAKRGTACICNGGYDDQCYQHGLPSHDRKLSEKLAADARRRKAALSSFQDHDILDLPAVDPKNED